jgi:hypothetical protein
MRIGNGLPMKSVAFRRFQGQLALASPLREFLYSLKKNSPEEEFFGSQSLRQ